MEVQHFFFTRDKVRWNGMVNNVLSSDFFKNAASVITTQQAFRTHFQLGLRASIPSWNTILRCMDLVRATGSTLKKKTHLRPKIVHTPLNIEAVRQSILRSAQRSARKLAVALTL